MVYVLEKANYYWIKCPSCGHPKMQFMRNDTKVVNFPAYCKRCKTENLITIAPKSQVVEPKAV